MIELKHRQEWEKSGVSKDLINLNIKSCRGYQAHERLLYNLNSGDRRNGGRVRDSILNRYSHCENGGWWVSGIDVLTGENSIWGQYKPDIPYSYTKKSYSSFELANKKIIKYEAPKNVPTEVIALAVPLYLWKAIGLKYNVALPKNITQTTEGNAIGFWQWIIDNPKIPIIITEGAKKAGSILTAEYVVIALPGIYSGYRQKKDSYNNKIGLPVLIPQLQVFAHPDREIIFCFDHDLKAKTRDNVHSAIRITAELFNKQKCQVSVITWTYPEKGVDDLIVTRGTNCFDELYKSRLSLSKFNAGFILDLIKYNPLIIDKHYLSLDIIPPSSAQIIGLRSPKASGKTEWLVKMTQKFIREGKPILIITHRIQLAKALCDRFGIDHIESIKDSQTKGLLGYGLCIDSLHPNSGAKFNPTDWEEAIIILDECEQVIWHALESSTCRNNRIAIIENFQQLLQVVISTGGKIYLSDADLSCISIDYIKNLINVPVNIWIVDNSYKSKTKRKLYNYSGNDPSELIFNLFKNIKNGSKVLVQTTGQKVSSKWGSITLESIIKKKFPDRRILRIDSESVSEPGHAAMGCIENLNNILPSYDIVICSPIIETGVSIDIKNHFDSVWCIAYGIQTVEAVCQTIERLRDEVDRHIWIKTTAKSNRIGNGSTSIKSLLCSQYQQTKNNIFLLQQAGFEEFDDLNIKFSPISLITWAKRACIVNMGKNNYRQEVINKLLDDGYKLINVSKNEDSSIIEQEIKQTSQHNYQKYCQDVSIIEDPTESELEILHNKKAKNLSERLTERKGDLIQRYGIKITPELVEKDDNNWYAKLQLQYYLTIGNIYLIQRDKKSLDYIKKEGNGKAFIPDINKRQLLSKIKALQIINIEQFFNEESTFSQSSLTTWLDFVIKLRFDIKTILGVNINPEKDTAIAVAQRILKKLGLKLNFKGWSGDRLSKQRIYSGCNLYDDHRQEIFKIWLLREASF
ncbi:hypothetical protein NIES4102_41790 (plasmid) [Chondrocystis sp. NIES-4102]|nr:hypothetical protein NIES4102_41790 [Chondrocystis sp. NIES-4102]